VARAGVEEHPLGRISPFRGASHSRSAELSLACVLQPCALRFVSRFALAGGVALRDAQSASETSVKRDRKSDHSQNYNASATTHLEAEEIQPWEMIESAVLCRDLEIAARHGKMATVWATHIAALLA
jgi:hypothetical protein